MTKSSHARQRETSAPKTNINFEDYPCTKLDRSTKSIYENEHFMSFCKSFISKGSMQRECTYDSAIQTS